MLVLAETDWLKLNDAEADSLVETDWLALNEVEALMLTETN